MINLLKRISDINYWKKVIYALIIGIAIVWFWRGVWQLTDIYLLPNNYKLSNWISLILAIVILIITQKALKKLM